MKKVIWNQDDEDFLKENYLKHRTSLCLMLNRTNPSINHRIKKLIGKRRKSSKKWNKYEDTFLIRHYLKYKPSLCVMLDRSIDSIYHRIVFLGLADRSKSLKGKPITGDHLENMRKSHKTQKYRDNLSISLEKSLKNKSMSLSELKFEKFIEKYNLPLKFVGNGKLIVNGFCPDFVNNHNTHLIELFGGYHDFDSYQIRDTFRLKSYIDNNYKVLIIRRWDINRKNESILLNKILEFLEK